MFALFNLGLQELIILVVLGALPLLATVVALAIAFFTNRDKGGDHSNG
jgi:hypothetical protein